MSEVAEVRVRTLNDGGIRPKERYVLYWMNAFRRPHHNHALDHAVGWAMKLDKPLLVFEALRVGYRWASDRIHRFILDAMQANAAYFADHDIAYFPYVEREEGDGSGLLSALAARAVLVVTDDFPSFFLPRMVDAAAQRLEEDHQVQLDAVDSNGLYPMWHTERVFTRAHDFRRHLQKNLLPLLDDAPLIRPFAGKDVSGARVERAVRERWAPASMAELAQLDLSALPIDHEVGIIDLKGGYAAGEAQLDGFLNGRLSRYADDRNHPDEGTESGLSPYLHFGNISSHQVFAAVAQREQWSSEEQRTRKATGKRDWWAMGEAAQAFLEELITWRELGYNMSSHRSDHDEYESLPDWALKTLSKHAGDPREHHYDVETFARAETHDPVWNAAQRELAQTGRMHNYLRMLWGKKILEWTASPREALQTMIELNNRFAIDGRNPNSYSGIFWVLGRYDRAWGPERPIYGKLRYMTSASAMRKLRMADYLDRWGES